MWYDKSKARGKPLKMRRKTKEVNTMKTMKVQFYGITTMGCGCYASVIVPEDYTMNQLVTAIRNAGYRTNTMKVLVEIQ